MQLFNQIIIYSIFKRLGRKQFRFDTLSCQANFSLFNSHKHYSTRAKKLLTKCRSYHPLCLNVISVRLTKASIQLISLYPNLGKAFRLNFFIERNLYFRLKDVLGAFKTFLTSTEKKRRIFLRKLLRDNGGEYLSTGFTRFLREEGIERQLLVPY
jgi:hypothetical protein